MVYCNAELEIPNYEKASFAKLRKHVKNIMSHYRLILNARRTY